MLTDALFDRIQPEPMSGCWLWTGSVVRGYGKLETRVRGRQRIAHRLVYILTVGPIPDGHDLHHRCGVKVCVNPAHLDVVLHRAHQRHHAVERRCLPDRPMTGAERQRACRVRWSEERRASERTKNAARMRALRARRAATGEPDVE